MKPPLSSFPTVRLQQPPSLSIGPGCRKELPDFLRSRGSRRVLFLASASCLAQLPGFSEELEKAVEEVVVRTGIPPEPAVADLEMLLGEFKGGCFDLVVGMGGGSVLDVAKLFSALHDTGTGPRAVFGNGKVAGRRLGLVCLPSTAGAGSEVSPNAILYDEEAGLKQAAISPWLVPDAAFVDPELTLSLPPETTAATGFDALCHCIEAYTNKHAHPVVDRIARDGIRLLTRHLATAVQDGGNLEARTAVALGSLYGGLCLGPVNTAGVHALSYPLGSRYRLPHGISNALLLTAVMEYSLPANPEKFADIARLAGVPEEKDDSTTAKAGIRHLRGLMKICRLPEGIRSLGVTDSEIPGLATAAMKVERLLRNNPRPIGQADAEHIYHQSL